MNLESSKAGACREPFTTVQVLRRAGHTWKEIAALSGVSVRTVTIGYSPLLSFRKGMSAPQTVTIGVLCRVLYPMPVRDRPSAPRERTVRRSAGLPARTPSAEASPSSGIALSPAQPAGYDVPSPVSGKHRLLLSVPGKSRRTWRADCARSSLQPHAIPRRVAGLIARSPRLPAMSDRCLPWASSWFVCKW